MKKEKKKDVFLFRKRPRFWTFLALALMILSGFLFRVYSKDGNQTGLLGDEGLVIFQGTTLAPVSNPANPPFKTVATLPVIITAYSSTPCQTDDSPFITASGSFVQDGVVANNYLPFGTKIKIPELYEDKIFIVEDRMSWKKSNNHFDIWFSEYSEALAFGAQRTYIEIVER